MTMPATQKIERLEKASLVVQVAIEHIDAPDIAPGRLADCIVTGRARRVFSGDCDEDAELSFTMTVYSENPPPGDCYADLGRVRSARFIEAYLYRDGDEPGLWRALDTALVEELGDKPGYLMGLRQAVADAKAEQERRETRRPGLLSFIGRLLGRH